MHLGGAQGPQVPFVSVPCVTLGESLSLCLSTSHNGTHSLLEGAGHHRTPNPKPTIRWSAALCYRETGGRASWGLGRVGQQAGQETRLQRGVGKEELVRSCGAGGRWTSPFGDPAHEDCESSRWKGPDHVQLNDSSLAS